MVIRMMGYGDPGMMGYGDPGMMGYGDPAMMAGGYNDPDDGIW